MTTLNKKSGVTLLELSIVLIVISSLTVIVIGAGKLVELSRLVRARSLTSKSPIDTIAGLVFWVEPTLKISLTINEALEGESVSVWNDLSPTSSPIDLSQNSAGLKPTFRKSAINKLPALEFDSNDYIESATYAIHPSDKTYTIIAVWQPITASGSDSLIAGNGKKYIATSSSNNHGIISHISGSSVDELYPTTYAVGTPYISTYVANDHITNSNLYVNGVSYNVLNATVDPQMNSETSSTVSIGSNIGAISSANAYIAEVIIYDHAIKTLDRQIVEKYLSDKYDINI